MGKCLLLSRKKIQTLCFVSWTTPRQQDDLTGSCFSSLSFPHTYSFRNAEVVYYFFTCFWRHHFDRKRLWIKFYFLPSNGNIIRVFSSVFVSQEYYLEREKRLKLMQSGDFRHLLKCIYDFELWKLNSEWNILLVLFLTRLLFEFYN